MSFRYFSKLYRGLNLQARGMSSSSKEVVTERLGKVFLIGINRPEKRNCVNFPTAAGLVEAFEEFERDDDLHAAVLYGKGGTFCAGFDLAQLSNYNGDKEILEQVYTPLTKKGMGPSAMRFSKPVIAAINGYAVAGGLELALMCDMRIVEENAIMGVFCRRFGVPLIDGGTARLPQLIGLSRAMDMILTGRQVNANEALEFGLANRVVAIGTSLGQAVNLANSIIKFPQECMRADRKSAYYSTYEATSIEDAIIKEFENAEHVISLEAVQGATKFVSGVGRHGKFNVDSKIDSKL